LQRYLKHTVLLFENTRSLGPLVPSNSAAIA
jgi:hypothetical protein